MEKTVYVVMTELNGYKNILSVWKHEEDARKVVERIKNGDSGRDAYYLKMPVHEHVYI